MKSEDIISTPGKSKSSSSTIPDKNKVYFSSKEKKDTISKKNKLIKENKGEELKVTNMDYFNAKFLNFQYQLDELRKEKEIDRKKIGNLEKQIGILDAEKEIDRKKLVI